MLRNNNCPINDRESTLNLSESSALFAISDKAQLHVSYLVLCVCCLEIVGVYEYVVNHEFISFHHGLFTNYTFFDIYISTPQYAKSTLVTY